MRPRRCMRLEWISRRLLRAFFDDDYNDFQELLVSSRSYNQHLIRRQTDARQRGFAGVSSDKGPCRFGGRA